MHTRHQLNWPGTDVQEVAAAFERDGVIAVRNLLPEEAVLQADGVADDLLATVNDQPWAAGEAYCERFDIWTKVFGGIEQAEVVALFDNEPMRQISAALAGAGAVAGRIGSWVTPPGCGQAWHQDSSSTTPGHFVLNRIAFTRDYDAGQGDLLFVPGSHRGGDLPAGQPFEPLDEQVALAPVANTVVFLHTRTFHCVTKNTTDQPRIQFNRRVVPAGVPADLTSRARFRNGTWDFSKQAPW